VNSKNYLIAAHRGASGYYTENTITAFAKAIELNADIIELDIR
jgi:glycerophosphoryl diester phosphodiesterase